MHIRARAHRSLNVGLHERGQLRLVAVRVGGGNQVAPDQAGSVDGAFEANHEAFELTIVSGVSAEDHTLRVMDQRAGAGKVGRRKIIGGVIVA